MCKKLFLLEGRETRLSLMTFPFSKSINNDDNYKLGFSLLTMVLIIITYRIYHKLLCSFIQKFIEIKDIPHFLI